MNNTISVKNTDAEKAWRNHVNFVLTWTGNQYVNLQLDATFGHEMKSVPTAGAGFNTFKDGMYYGVAGYVRIVAHPIFAINLRGEFYGDPNGIRLGTAQNLVGITLTPEIKAGDNFLVRLEGRVDISDQQVFVKEGGKDPATGMDAGLATEKIQGTIAANIVAKY